MILRSSISLPRYFKKLPLQQDTGVGEVVTKRANQRVQAAMSKSQGSSKRKQSVNTDERQTQIGWHADENRITAVLRHFRNDFPGLSESAICGYKMKFSVATKR